MFIDFLQFYRYLQVITILQTHYELQLNINFHMLIHKSGKIFLEMFCPLYATKKYPHLTNFYKYQCSSNDKKPQNHEQAPVKQNQKIQITTEQLSQMYKFMTNADLSFEDPRAKSQKDPSQNCTTEYFSDPLQKLSLGLLQLQAPEQFLSWFKKYKADGAQLRQGEWIQAKLLILYQYCKVGGKIQFEPKLQKGKILETMAFEYLKELTKKQSMEKLDQAQLQNLLLIYQNNINQIEKNKLHFLPPIPPMIPNYTSQSTSLLKVLANVYQQNRQAIILILNHYKPNSKECKHSCWQLMSVYMIVLNHYFGIGESEEGERSKQKAVLKTHLEELRRMISKQFREIITQEAKQQIKNYDSSQNDSIIKYSPIPFLELLIKNTPILENVELGIDSLPQIIFNQILFPSQNQLQFGTISFLLYTTSVTLEQQTNASKISSPRASAFLLHIYNELFRMTSKFLQSNVSINYQVYMMLWKTAMVVYRIKIVDRAHPFQLIQYLIANFDEDTIKQKFIETCEYHELYLAKQNQVFQMLVTYRILLPAGIELQGYPKIFVQIQNNRPSLTKMLTELRKIYERYILSGNLSPQFQKNIIICAIISNAYSKQTFLSPTIVADLQVFIDQYPQHKKIITNIIQKHNSQL